MLLNNLRPNVDDSIQFRKKINNVTNEHDGGLHHYDMLDVLKKC